MDFGEGLFPLEMKKPNSQCFFPGSKQRPSLQQLMELPLALPHTSETPGTYRVRSTALSLLAYFNVFSISLFLQDSFLHPSPHLPQGFHGCSGHPAHQGCRPRGCGQLQLLRRQRAGLGRASHHPGVHRYPLPAGRQRPGKGPGSELPQEGFIIPPCCPLAAGRDLVACKLRDGAVCDGGCWGGNPRGSPWGEWHRTQRCRESPKPSLSP